VNLRKVIRVLAHAALAAVGVWVLGWLIAALSAGGAGFSPAEAPVLVWLLAEATLLVALAYGLIRTWEE
jgi:hypothetical protein